MSLEKMKVSESDIENRKQELENIKTQMYLAHDGILTFLNLINLDYEVMDEQDAYKILIDSKNSAKIALNQLMKYLGNIWGENFKYYKSLNRFINNGSCDYLAFMQCLETHINEISLEVGNIEKGR